MALLHRDRPDTTTDDTIAGPAWPSATPEGEHAHGHAPNEVVVRRNSFGQTLRTILATILLVGVVAVAAANTDDIGVDLLFDDYTTSVTALVGISAGAGFLIGALLAWRRRGRAV